jgi:pSer/pThr/pTyr-binding forkhead associated (FHA) protein
MLDIFKNNQQTGERDVKIIRDQLLQFIKSQLQKVEGGEGNNIKGLHLFIACSNVEKYMYEAAVYYDEEDRFKNEEVQRIADDYAIDLPANWVMEIVFTDVLPAEAVKVQGLDAALFIQTKKRALIKSTTAVIRVLNGEAEQEEYTITSTSGKVTIGREKKIQTPEGFIRENIIAFPANSSDESNKFVSRQHAHIEWDNDSGVFCLFADEGGIPPRNKIKLRSADGELEKLQTMEIGHQLKDGDQIILGDSAVLEFRYSTGS